jgi:hypothetical protein
MMVSKRIATALLLAACALAPAVRAQSAEQLAALVTEAMPLGELFQTFIDSQPQWPFGPKASRVSDEQLQCVRARLSAKGYREQRLEQAQAFARRYPDKLEPSVGVLRDGGAAMFASSIRAGMEQAKTGQTAKVDTLTSRFTPGQLAALIELTSDDKHKALRELIGIDEVVNVNNPAGDNESRGRNKGRMIGMKLMLSALDHCKVPLSAVE